MSTLTYVHVRHTRLFTRHDCFFALTCTYALCGGDSFVKCHALGVLYMGDIQYNMQRWS